MKNLIFNLLNKLLKPFSIELCRSSNKIETKIPYDFSELEKSTFLKVCPYTMTSPERVAVLVESVRHVKSLGIEGDIVECGVWKGGSAMAVAISLQSLGEFRHLWLYDTYEGMSEPTAIDVSYDGETAKSLLTSQDIQNDRSVWCYSSLDEVKSNLATTGYPDPKIHFIKGRVEDTIPDHLPDKIAILRLDTDWYESTRHELEHLYPRLVTGGVLIVDDYGYWKGSRQAVDEYFDKHGPRPLLVRIDNTARICIKP